MTRDVVRRDLKANRSVLMVQIKAGTCTDMRKWREKLTLRETKDHAGDGELYTDERICKQTQTLGKEKGDTQVISEKIPCGEWWELTGL